MEEKDEISWLKQSEFNISKISLPSTNDLFSTQSKNYSETIK